jgi:NADPH:quinone reductase
MRAVLVHEFGDPRSLSLEQVPDPSPGPQEVLIDVAATAVNFVDLLVIEGRYQFLPQRPFSPGKLPAGTVAAVGAEVRDVAVGDRVLTLAEHGGYAERAVVPASQVFRLPDAMSFVDAASMALAFDTAWFALRERVRLQAGETVLVLGGSGGVGLAAIQLAKAFGARVIAGIASQAKAKLVEDAGADAIVDLGAPDIHEALRAQVQALTEGRGADVIIDPLGDKFFGAALRSLAWCGRLCVVGFAAGEIPTVKANYLLLKNIEVSGLQVSDYRKRRPGRMAECLREIFSLYGEGVLTAPPATTLPLGDFGEALERVRGRRASGRLVLTPQAAGRAGDRA